LTIVIEHELEPADHVNGHNDNLKLTVLEESWSAQVRVSRTRRNKSPEKNL